VSHHSTARADACGFGLGLRRDVVPAAARAAAIEEVGPFEVAGEPVMAVLLRAIAPQPARRHAAIPWHRLRAFFEVALDPALSVGYVRKAPFVHGPWQRRRAPAASISTAGIPAKCRIDCLLCFPKRGIGRPGRTDLEWDFGALSASSASWVSRGSASLYSDGGR
jgi:hypothetical protein